MSYPKKMPGIIKRHPDGFGFFIPDDPNHPDVYIPAHFMKGVMTQDRVTALIDRDGRKDRFWGKIISIDKRYWSQIVAPIEIKGNRYQLLDVEGAWGQNIIVEVPPDIKGIRPHDLVVVELTHFHDSQKGLTGRLIKVLGGIEQAQFDVERIARTHGIPFEFSKAALEQAKKKFKPTVSERDLKNRKNLQKLHFVTIDGATAKDFDDAIYVEKTRSGWTLFVAIADVSHYVKPGSPIDKEAYERGTSSYFPNFVIPMLPEILSNELCSLKPNVVRLAFICEMQIDHHGNLKKYDFYEASICSRARVTYGQAQEILDGISVKGLEHVEADILRAKPLAQLLLKKRLNEGSLDLEIPETQVLVDALGEPVDILKTHRLFSHRMIEEFMLIANVATARFFEDHKITGIYRVHEDPKSDALEQLAKFSKSFGLSLNLNSSKLQIELRNAINQLKGSVQGEIFSNLVLRSMKQAKYSAENIGHFGLAFSHYSHFTSPIRRYPDLIAHRLIKAKLKKDKKAIPDFTDMQEKCTWLSSAEQRSVKAERAIIGIKKARLMQKYLGQEFVGVVSSVTKFGIFVTLRQLEVEGLVHTDNLSKDPNSRWKFDEDKLILFEQRSGKRYQLGDEVTIQVAATNVMDGKIDFVLAGLYYTDRDKKAAKVLQNPGSTKNKAKSNDKSQKAHDPTPTHSLRPAYSPKSDNSPKSTSGFDPGAKLLEALRKKGLKPSHQLLQQEFGDRQEFGKGMARNPFETKSIGRFTKPSDDKSKKSFHQQKGTGKSKNKKTKGKRR